MNLTKQEILNYLELINSELTDAYNTGSTEPENSDSLYFIDTARELVDELTTRIEDPQEEPVPHEDMDREGGLMVHIEPGQYFSGDGEGRLKGEN